MSKSNSVLQIEIKHEPAVIIGLSLALFLTIYAWPESAARIILGGLSVLFFPGYSLVAALVPERDSISGTARVSLGFALSVAVMPVMGLFLNFTSWGIELKSILISTVLLILLFCGIAYYRRYRLAPDKRFVIRLEFDLECWQAMEHLDKILSVMLILSVLCAIGAFVYAIARPKAGERFTEFYILGPNGTAEDYPSEVVAGEPINLIIGVANYEQDTAHYVIERRNNGNVEQAASFALGHEQRWEQPHTFTLIEPGKQKVMFLLYKNGDVEPYRSLHLWIIVKEPTLDPD